MQSREVLVWALVLPGLGISTSAEMQEKRGANTV